MNSPVRVALVAGAVGRFGEAMLNRVLGSRDYDRVVVLAQGPMALGVSGLELATLADLPPIGDVFIAVSEGDDSAGRSFYGRDAPFVKIGKDQVLSVARHACAVGARRLVLVAPTSVWQQIGGLHAGLSGHTELALADLALTSLTVLRPVVASPSRARGWVERVAAVYTSLQMLAMPRSLEMMPSEKLARCALEAMRQAADGVRILGADKISTLLAAAQGSTAGAPASGP